MRIALNKTHWVANKPKALADFDTNNTLSYTKSAGGSVKYLLPSVPTKYLPKHF